MYCELCGCNCDGDEIEMKSGLCCHCYHSTRNQFAAAALTGLLAIPASVDNVPGEAFKFADAMMKARKDGGE